MVRAILKNLGSNLTLLVACFIFVWAGLLIKIISIADVLMAAKYQVVIQYGKIVGTYAQQYAISIVLISLSLYLLASWVICKYVFKPFMQSNAGVIILMIMWTFMLMAMSSPS